MPEPGLNSADDPTAETPLPADKLAALRALLVAAAGLPVEDIRVLAATARRDRAMARLAAAVQQARRVLAGLETGNGGPEPSERV